MAFYSLPPLLVPLAPGEGATPQERSDWEDRLVAFLGNMGHILEELGDSYISLTDQLSDNIVTYPKLSEDIQFDLSSAATFAEDMVSYTSTGAPTNSPTPSSLQSTLQNDASVSYLCSFTYTQPTSTSALKADGFAFFVANGDTTPTTTAGHFLLQANNTTTGVFSTLIQIDGAAQDQVLSFGVAAFRKSAEGYELGGIVTSAAAPDWQGVTQGTPNYIANIWGKEQHNFVISATGLSANEYPTMGVTKDGSALTWTGANSHYAGATVNRQGFDLLIYNLLTKSVEYAHAYATRNLRTHTLTTADYTQDDSSGLGSGDGVGFDITGGKWGAAVKATSLNGSTRVLCRTVGTDSRYSAARTVECWAKTTGTGTLIALSTGSTMTSGTRVDALQILGTGFLQGACLSTAGATVTVSSLAAVNDGTYHHFCTQISDTGTLRLYVDGVIQGCAGSGLVSMDSQNTSQAKYLGLFHGTSSTAYAGTAWIDELAVSTAQINGNVTSFTPRTTEYNDVGHISDPATALLLHFQRRSGGPIFTNALRPAWSLVEVINSYESRVSISGIDAFNFAYFIAGQVNPTLGRDQGGLSTALAAIGSSRRIFDSDAWQEECAYVLVGRSLAGEGNGYERYAGQSASSTNAFATLAVQTQDEDLISLGGLGWEPTFIPGPPDNNPTPSSATTTSLENGQQIVDFTWSYTQPSLSGTTKLADGFIFYVKKGDTATPDSSPDAAYMLSIEKRSCQIQAPYGQVWSAGVASFRRTADGVEVGPAQTSSSSPDWRGIAGSKQIGTTGIANLAITEALINSLAVSTAKLASAAVTTAKLTDASVTSTKRQLVASQSYATTGSFAANSSSGPVLFNSYENTFSHSLGVSPVVTPYSTLTLCIPKVSGVNSTNIGVVMIWLGSSASGLNTTIYYW